MERAAPRIAKSTNLISGSLRGIGGLVAGAFAIGGMVNFGRAAINLASDLQEVENVVSVTFGGMAAEVDAWSKQMLNSFGLSELSAKKYSSTMGAMLKSSGLTGVAMKDMSKNLTELAADMASFYNLSTDEAFYKVFAGMTGETEPLKALGVNLSVANMEAFALSKGITKSYQAMSQAEQTLLRYQYLLSVTGDAQGDFARNGQSWANQTRVLTEQWRIFQGTMGAGFINILTPVVRWLNVLIQRLQVAAQYFKALTEVLFGAQSATGSGAAVATSAADAMGGIGDQADAAAKGVKKAKKELSGLSGLDQFNLIKTKDDDAGSGSGLSAVGGIDMGALAAGELPTPDVNTDVFRDKMQALVDNTKRLFSVLWQWIRTNWGDTILSFGRTIETARALVVPELEKWKTTFQTMFSDIITLGAPLRDWFADYVVPAWHGAILLTAQIVAGLSETVRTVFNDIWAAAFPILQKFVTEGLPRLTEFVIGVGALFGSLLGLVKQIFDDIWRGAAQPAMALLSKIIQDTLGIIHGWWDTWGKGIMTSLKTMIDRLKGLWSSFWQGFLQPFIQNMLRMVSWLWDKHLKGLVKEIADFVGILIKAAIDIYNDFIAPIVKYLMDILGPAVSNTFSLVVDVIGTAIGIIVDILAGLIKSFGGVVEFIAGVFTLDWQRAWAGIERISQGVTDSLVGIFRGAVNLIIDAINFMIRSLNNVKIDIPDWISKIPGMPDNLKSIGFSIPQIPKLANGGVVSAPTLAMVGDNRNASIDPEVVSPLSKLEEMMAGSNVEMVAVLLTMLDVLREIARKNPSLQIGESELGRIAARAINTNSRQTGQPILGI